MRLLRAKRTGNGDFLLPERFAPVWRSQGWTVGLDPEEWPSIQAPTPAETLVKVREAQTRVVAKKKPPTKRKRGRPKGSKNRRGKLGDGPVQR